MMMIIVSTTIFYSLTVAKGILMIAFANSILIKFVVISAIIMKMMLLLLLLLLLTMIMRTVVMTFLMITTRGIIVFGGRFDVGRREFGLLLFLGFASPSMVTLFAMTTLLL